MKTLSDKRGYFPRTHQVIYLDKDVKQFIKEIETDANDIFKINVENSNNGVSEKLRLEVLDIIAGALNELLDIIKERAGNKLLEEKPDSKGFSKAIDKSKLRGYKF